MFVFFSIQFNTDGVLMWWDGTLLFVNDVEVLLFEVFHDHDPLVVVGVKYSRRTQPRINILQLRYDLSVHHHLRPEHVALLKRMFDAFVIPSKKVTYAVHTIIIGSDRSNFLAI